MNTNRFRILSGAKGSAKERKQSLRAYMKRRRGENENRDVKENLLVEHFFDSGAGEKESFFVYLSFSSEAPTDKLIEELLSRGKRVYCPRIDSDTESHADSQADDRRGAKMVAVPFGEDMTLSKYGIREPSGDAYDGDIDVIVMPLLAVDERGVRLGYGGGYYDAFIKQHPSSEKVAYCFDFQIVRETPSEEWDERADIIVTDKRVVRVENTSNI